MSSFDFKTSTKQYISRWVAFVVTPLIAAVTPAVTKFLNNVLSLDLSSNEVKTFAVAQIGTVTLGGIVWLINRGRWERQAADFEKELETNPLPTDTPVPVEDDSVPSNPSAGS